MWTGRNVKPFLNQGVTITARALGASPQTADNFGMASEIVVGLGLGGWAGALRLSAVRAGRISLIAHEAAPGTIRPGGHTISKHVAKDLPYLEERLLKAARIFAQNSNKKIPKTFSTFFSLEEAEKFISQALRAKRAEIEIWAKTAPAGMKKIIDFEFGTRVGWGIFGRGWTPDVAVRFTELTKIQIVLKKETYNGMAYYILTCYPIL